MRTLLVAAALAATAVGRVSSLVAQEAVTPMRGEVKGVLILSFDDRNFEDWRDAIPLFDKYGAHATFFVSGEIDNDAARTMKLLHAHGHSIGLHGLCHADADTAIAAKGVDRYYDDDIARQRRACDVCHVPVCCFGYPNGRRTEESDRLFYDRGFERVRCSLPGATPYDPKGTKQAARKPLPANEALFFPAKDLPKHRLIETITVGEAYRTDIEEVVACLARAAARREVFAITSHGIGPDARDINMKAEWLERILAEAQKLGLRVIGFDELPPPDGRDVGGFFRTISQWLHLSF